MILLAITKINILTNASHVWVLSSTNFKFFSIWSFNTLGNIPHFTVQPNIIKMEPVRKTANEVHRERQQREQPMATSCVKMTLSCQTFEGIKVQKLTKKLIIFGLFPCK